MILMNAECAPLSSCQSISSSLVRSILREKGLVWKLTVSFGKMLVARQSQLLAQVREATIQSPRQWCADNMNLKFIGMGVFSKRLFGLQVLCQFYRPNIQSRHC